MLATVALLVTARLVAGAPSPRPPPPSPPKSPNLYIVAQGTCPYDYSGLSMTCNMLDASGTAISLKDNMVRAGLVWSGSLRGSVDVVVPGAERAAMRVSLGGYTNTSLTEVGACASQTACAPLVLTVGEATYAAGAGTAPITLAWMVASPYAPVAKKWEGSWTGWMLDLQYAFAALFALPAAVYVTYTLTAAEKPKPKPKPSGGGDSGESGGDDDDDADEQRSSKGGRNKAGKRRHLVI